MSSAQKEAILAKLMSIEKKEVSRGKLKVKSLEDNPYQPRLSYDKAELEVLASSIEENGLLQSIVVLVREGRHIIVAGHRRKRAFEMLEKEEIPVTIINDISDADLMILAGVENVVRRDLSLMEEAKMYRDITASGITASELAMRFGTSVSAISRKKHLLNLNEEILEDLRVNKSSKDVVALTALRKIKDEKYQVELYFEFLKKGKEWLLNEIEKELNIDTKIESKFYKKIVQEDVRKNTIIIDTEELDDNQKELFKKGLRKLIKKLSP